jgi:PAS domain S-box-containing protein
MAAFAEQRQRRAEREFERIFEMSAGLLFVLGFDGYLRSVNPAFEQTFGHSGEKSLASPFTALVYPDDRQAAEESLSALRRGEAVEQAETRYVRSDGAVRWLQWSARSVPEEGLIYGAARDTTGGRQAAEEQAALRRVATLVARGVAPETVFAAVAEEAGRLLGADIAMIGRYSPRPSFSALVGWRHDGEPVPLGKDVSLGGENVMSRVFQSREPARIEASKASGELAKWERDTGIGSAVGAPITVEGRVWGVVMISLDDESPWPADAEKRLANFTELAAAALANAQAREELRQVADEQAALRRVATLVARGQPPSEVLAAVAAEVGKLMSADLALIGRYGSGPSVSALVSWRRDGRPVELRQDVDLGGRNVMSQVFDSGRPARIDSYSEASGPVAGWARDSGAVATVGAPITVEGRVWGVIIVCLEEEGVLPPETEERLAKFTELAGTAIANTAARDELREVAAEQAALRRVATLVARGVAPEIVFNSVAEEVATVLPNVDHALIGRYRPDHAVELVGGWSAIGAVDWVGQSVSIGGRNVTTAVFETRQPARVDQLAEEPTEATVLARRSGARSSAGAPIELDGQLWGVMIVASVHEAVLPRGIEHELAAFIELVATAIANAESRSELAASRARIVTASDDARRRIERDLHDGAQQRLVALALGLRSIQDALLPERPDVSEELARTVEALDGVFAELQRISRGIHPAILSDGGLGPALRMLARRSAIPVELDVEVEGRLPEAVEVAAYYVVSEALTNAAKHSSASVVYVDVAVQEAELHVEVRDDGAGGAAPEHGSGLIGLMDRVEALGGSLAVTSPAGEGTTLTGSLPLVGAAIPPGAPYG